MCCEEFKEVHTETVRKLLDFSIGKNLIPNLQYKVRVYYFENSFGVVVKDKYKFVDTLLIPCIINNNSNNDNTLLDDVNNIHKIDIAEILEECGLDYKQSYELFSVLHEIGHMNLVYKDINRYGYAKRTSEWESDYHRNKEGVLPYRMIREERFADNFAIQIILKHAEELANLYLDIECEVGEEV